MNGVLKYKENFFLRYKKEIALTLGAVLTFSAVVRYAPSDVTQSGTIQARNSNNQSVEEQLVAKGYNVLIDGVGLGVVRNKDEGQAATNQALEMVIADLGYNPEVEPVLTFENDYSEEENYIAPEELAALIASQVIHNLERHKVMAYVMKIGDDFTVAVKNEEDIKKVLLNAQSIYVNTDMALDISLAKDEHNGLIIKPQVIMLKEDEGASNRTFTTTITANAETIDEASLDTPKDVSKEGVTVEVDFAESVMAVEAYVFEDEVLSVDEATALITKENEEAKLYTVVSGDAPSTIAANNSMPLAQLYELNPGLEQNTLKMKIGDELVVMVPEPELSIATKEEVVYTESIIKGVSYVDNPNVYKGSDSVVDAGYDGVLELTAVVSKVNGKEIGREITKQTVLQEAKDKVISRGIKPLPKKGATGNYKFPLTSFKVTSPFGRRWGAFHAGVDLSAPSGTTVRASDGGTVTIAGWRGNYGYLVEIDHGNGIRTRYGHNSKIEVKVGQKVAQYETIAKVGSTGRSTGPHVHFEIRFDGVAANPMNYLEY
ncbi:M23 family metallopeptidase [Petrocella sp. FN5]|uniref:M23 family metallopeptidase n=1 Tax=Petrocella sp. FN5 TaxID=3032002 RepID=UPI0023D9B9FB|nr:M23 family metallopeptidase [Petrocella sp. FN5]MDF1616439.1 M23 family metallopeptidase [Petrocella sp. FN5]